MKHGRKSRAELEMTDTVIVDVSRRMPAAPPSELSDAQAQVWRDAVSSMPGNWLSAWGTRNPGRVHPPYLSGTSA